MRLPPRWRKVFRDIQQRPGRTLLATLAMATGVFQIAAMLYAYSILSGTLGGAYGRTRPASAVLVAGSVTDALVDSVRRVPGVADAEARPVIMGRIALGRDQWVPAMFYVVRDFDRQRIDTFEPNDGAWPPGPGDVLLEQTALSVAHARNGDSVTVRTAGGTDVRLGVAGTVHAEGLPPAWMEHMVPGFVSWNSALRRSAGDEAAQIRIVVADLPLDEEHIREVAARVKLAIERQGVEVSWVNVPPPGRHPHADQMATFLYLLGAFGILGFVLSAVLVAGMIHGLLAEQLRQVGIMKAIGARTAQIAALYLGQVLLLATAALAIGLPAGMYAGRRFAAYMAGMFNIHVTNTTFPLWLLGAEILAGVLVPLLVALGPVLGGARITVHEALAGDFGSRAFGTRRLERRLARIAGLPRPLVLSMRTTFLRRGRLATTVGMLALGGALFMAAQNVAGAWVRAVEQDFRTRGYDLTVALTAPAPIPTLEPLLAGTAGVSRAEYWTEGGGTLVNHDGSQGAQIGISGVPAATRLLAMPLLAGRWLNASDRAAVVVNQATLTRDPSLGVGRPLRLRIKGARVSWPIVGVVNELIPMPVAYAPPAAVALAIHAVPGTARTIRVVTSAHDDAAVRSASAALERTFAAAGLELAGIQRSGELKQALLDHVLVLLTVLTLASAIVLFVGAVGLASTLSLNVVQRTREIGILSAIGARPRTISRHVWIEGVTIGVLSWACAVVLSAPVSLVLEAVCGRMFFRAPLAFYMSPLPALAWLGLVVVLATVSSLQPAWRASRLTVREALAHE